MLRNVMGGATMVIKPGQQNEQAAPAVSEDSVSGWDCEAIRIRREPSYMAITWTAPLWK